METSAVMPTQDFSTINTTVSSLIVCKFVFHDHEEFYIEKRSKVFVITEQRPRPGAIGVHVTSGAGEIATVEARITRWRRRGYGLAGHGCLIRASSHGC